MLRGDSYFCKNKLKEAIPLLIEYLKSTENNILRNSIALTLSDIGSEEAVKPLIDMINHPKTLGVRGTLKYALKAFDCSGHLVRDALNEIERQHQILSVTLERLFTLKKDIADITTYY